MPSKYVKVPAESVVLTLTPRDAQFLNYLLGVAVTQPQTFNGDNPLDDPLVKAQFMAMVGRLRAKLRD